MEHGGKSWIDSDERKEFNSHYQTAFWKKKRLAQLSMQPLCQACLLKGKISSAIHVDHVFAWKNIGHEAFKRNLFQSLCPECHSHKTALEHQGIYQCYISEQKDYALADYKYLISQGIF